MAADARSTYDAAALQVRKCLRMKGGGVKAERIFGAAYQRLVREQGVAQLRTRYRP